MQDKTVVKNLGNSVRLMCCDTQRFKNSRISVRFAVKPEKEKRAAFALLPGLIKYTSARYPNNIDTEKKLASLYGASFSASVSKSGDAVVFSFVLNCIDNRFALDGEDILSEGVGFLISSILSPDLDKDGLFKVDNINREKRLLKEDIEAEQNDKIVYANKIFESKFYNSEPAALSVKGEIEDIDKVGAREVTEAWQIMLKHSPLYIGIVANGTEKAADSIIKAFTPLRGEAVSGASKIHITVNENIFTDYAEVSQGKLVMGWSIAERDRSVLRVFNSLFGGGVNSKLFKIVRESMSLCYYCSSRTNYAKGTLTVQSGIDSADRERASSAIKQQLEDIKNGNFSEEDLRLVKISLDDAFRSIHDTAREIDAWYAANFLYDEIRDAETERKEVARVTREQVIAAANSMVFDTEYALLGKENEVD